MFEPYRAVWKQAGPPPGPRVASAALLIPGPRIGGGVGPATSGRTGPAATWRTVRTLTLWLACPASQASTLVSSGLVTPSAQSWAHTSWMLKMIQPPPRRCAPVTMDSNVAGVHRVPTEATSIGARSRYGLCGGIVSAQPHESHSPAPRSSPAPSPVLYPHRWTRPCSVLVASANGYAKSVTCIPHRVRLPRSWQISRCASAAGSLVSGTCSTVSPPISLPAAASVRTSCSVR